MKTYLFILSCFLFCLSVNPSNAQSIFGANVVVGGNMAQMSGDASAGFNKVGIHAGIKGTVRLNYRSEMGIGIIYDQRGSKSGKIFSSSVFPFNISLDYINVPVTYSFKDWYDDERKYYKLHFTGGISYGRLFRREMTGSRISEGCLQNIRENDLSWLLGASYYWSPSWAVTAFHQRTVIDANKELGDCTSDLRPYNWTLRLEYRF